MLRIRRYILIVDLNRVAVRFKSRLQLRFLIIHGSLWEFGAMSRRCYIAAFMVRSLRSASQPRSSPVAGGSISRYKAFDGNCTALMCTAFDFVLLSLQN